MPSQGREREPLRETPGRCSGESQDGVESGAPGCSDETVPRMWKTRAQQSDVYEEGSGDKMTDTKDTIPAPAGHPGAKMKQCHKCGKLGHYAKTCNKEGAAR